MTDLPELLDASRISLHCDIRSKKRALQTIAELLGEHLRKASAADPEASSKDEAAKDVEVSDMQILDALIVRERLGSTGIGHGIALPHSRLEEVQEPIAALITLKEGVDFESIDGGTVDVVLGLLVPKDCNDEHLQILASLAKRFSHEEFRSGLRACDSGEALMARLTADAAAS